MIVGYARVSNQEQSLDAQIEELKAAGCERVFAEKESGAKSNRPALANGVQFGRKKKLTHFQRQEALARLEAGETQSVIAKTYGVDRFSPTLAGRDFYVVQTVVTPPMKLPCRETSRSSADSRTNRKAACQP